MQKRLKAFQINVDGKVLDYRLGKLLDLDQVRASFERRYKVAKIWSGGRHILGILKKDHRTLFLKLATTQGISAVTKNEYLWNEQFNKLVSRQTSNFWVPKNEACGLYNAKLFYLITDKFDGELLAERPQGSEISPTFLNTIPSVIKFSELIQKLDLENLSSQKGLDYRKVFFEKSTAWYNDIPKAIREKHKVLDLLRIVENGFLKLEERPRHGDFTPWHLIKLKEGQLGLIDGEHAMGDGVEYYDIGYFIQRVFSVLENPNFAKEILSILEKNNYNLRKLKVILAARAIGGFLDESLKPNPDYKFSKKFKDLVISIT